MYPGPGIQNQEKIYNHNLVPHSLTLFVSPSTLFVSHMIGWINLSIEHFITEVRLEGEAFILLEN